MLYLRTAIDSCFNWFTGVKDIALADLAPTHPIRLGLALNFSVFYYEILNASEKACSMAKQVSCGPSFARSAGLASLFLLSGKNMHMNW